MVAFVNYLVVLLACVSFVAAQSYPYCKVVNKAINYTLQWDLSTEGRIQFLVQAQTSGWLGLGLSTGGMTSNGAGSDVWVGFVNPSSTSNCTAGCLYDYVATQYAQPAKDPPASQSLTLINGNYSNGVTTLEFSRALDTGDANDRVIYLNESTIFIWATNVTDLPPDVGVPFVRHTNKGSFTVNLTEPSSCLPAAPTPSPLPPVNPNSSFTSPDGTYEASWVISPETSTITFTVSAITTGWVGIGVGVGQVEMPTMDVYVGWINPNGSVTVTDRYAQGYYMPANDTSLGGQENAFNISGSLANGVTTIVFSRLLDTGDKWDNVISQGENNTIIWAYGAPGSVNYNSSTFSVHTKKGGLFLELYPSNGTNPTLPPTPTPTPTPAPGSNNSFTSPDGAYQASWVISFETKTITFTLTANTVTGWVGIGFGNGSITMQDMDVYVGWVNPNGTVTVSDRYAQQFAMPVLDTSLGGQENVFNISGFTTSTTTTVVFSRLLDTGDVWDYVIPSGNATTTVIWAYGGPNSVNYNTSVFQQHVDRGGLFLDLASSTPPPNPTPSPSPTPTPSPTGSNSSFTTPDGTYRASWVISKENKTITFTVTAATTGWVGIGFGNRSVGMTDMDVYVGWVQVNSSGSFVTVTDRYAKGTYMPALDTTLGGQENIFDVSGFVANGSTTVTFSRLLDTGDVFDYVIAEGNTTTVIWAYGSSGSVNYETGTFQQHTNRGGLYLDLFAGGCFVAPGGINWVKVHGIIMTVCVCLLFYPGILLARFFKILIPKWFYMHATMQTVGFAGIIAALVIVLYARSAVFYVGWHELFGIITFSGFGLEVLFGYASHFMFDPTRKRPPIFPDVVHWWFGRLVFVSSLVTIFLGLRLYGADKIYQIMYLTWVGLAALVVVVLQILVGQSHETSSDPETVKLNPSANSEYSAHKKGTGAVFVLIGMVVASAALLLAAYLYKPASNTLGGAC